MSTADAGAAGGSGAFCNHWGRSGSFRIHCSFKWQCQYRWIWRCCSQCRFWCPICWCSECDVWQRRDGTVGQLRSRRALAAPQVVSSQCRQVQVSEWCNKNWHSNLNCKWPCRCSISAVREHLVSWKHWPQSWHFRRCDRSSVSLEAGSSQPSEVAR